MLAVVAERVELVEVAPRDGLQNEERILSTEQKLELAERAARTGARRVEVASFVRPDLVPQLADAEAVAAGLPELPGVRWSALVLNERGYERAVAAGFRELNTVVSATESFSERNQGMSLADAAAMVARLRKRAAADGVFLCVTVSVAFGCPFDGELPVARLRETLAPLAGVDELALADTIGVAVPTDVEERFALADGLAPLRAHFHDTRNTGVANAIAAVRAGVRTLDASLAGIGGCPFAPAATGNVATEDVAYALGRMGYDTGLDLDGAIAAARWLADAVGHAPAGMVARAGRFP
jgi:hydroxymethylglutaryl-CoA lyase